MVYDLDDRMELIWQSDSLSLHVTVGRHGKAVPKKAPPKQYVVCKKKTVLRQCQPFMDVSGDKSDPKIEATNDVIKVLFLFGKLKRSC